MARVARLVLILALFCAADGHLLVMQSTAWAGMLFHRARICALPEAVSSTFDGRHPCQMCLEIQKAAEAEKKPEAAPQPQKIDFHCRPVEPLLPPLATSRTIELSPDLPLPSLRSPETPPPRDVSA